MNVTLIVFGRVPVSGRAKTRLIPMLGADGAAALHAALFARALDAARRSNLPLQVALAGTPEEMSADFAERMSGLQISQQQGADLGARMLHAMQQVYATGRRPLLFGTDCPAIDARYLQEAARQLAAAPAQLVLGPAEDGGYGLIGISHTGPQLPAELFSELPWGSERVAELTRLRAASVGLPVTFLEPLWDVDRPADVQRLVHEYPQVADAAGISAAALRWQGDDAPA